MLKLNQLSKGYQQPDGFLPVLRDVTASLEAGESAALLGESGSGKSTLLHLIAGLDRPDSGEVWLASRKLPDNSSSDWNQIRRETVSLVFQDFHLIPTLNVSDNVHLQARLAGRLDADFIASLIDRLGLTNLLNRMPHELSGGQQQRVAIARALAHRPTLVLADEPTGNLDENTAKDVLALFVDCVQQANSSLLMVTHSAKMAEFLDHRWQLRDGSLHVA